MIGKGGVAVQCDAVWNDKPLAALLKHVAERSRYMSRAWADSAIGAMVQVCKSLRSASLEAKASRYDPSQITEIGGGLSASYTRAFGATRRCLRNPQGVRDTVIDRRFRVIYRCRPNSTSARPFLVKPMHERQKPYVVVAESAGDAKAVDKNIQAKRKRMYGQFAKTALGFAMGALSTRHKVPLKRFTAKTPWSALVAAGLKKSEGEEEVYMRDMLDYATLAVKGGRAGVDAAVMKTANKVYGEVQHYLNKNGLNLFKEERAMPFPDVSRAYA